MRKPAITVEQLIEHFGLIPLPGEGGLFRETYRSPHTFPSGGETSGGAEKPFGTAILYLLTAHPDSFSALHRLKTDEIYHFYLGDPLEMTLLHPGGAWEQAVLGQEVLGGQRVQMVVPAGAWQGSRLAAGGSYALVGTTMAPGFTPDDFELGQRADLLARWPQAAAKINALTRG